MAETRFPFTKERLQRILPANKGERVVYYDSKCPGLQIRVTARGVKTFSYYRRLKGRAPVRLSLGRFPEVTVEQVRKRSSVLNAEIEAGGDPAAIKRAYRGSPTFAQAFETYIEKKRNRQRKAIGDSTKRDYRDLVRLHLSSISDHKLSQVTKDKVRELHEVISKRSPAQADKVLAVISAVFNFAISRNSYSGANPATGVLKNPAAERDRIVRLDELPFLLDALDRSALSDFFWVSLLTGARRSNVQSMSWKDVSLEEAEWRIPMTKNGSPQTVHLIAKLVEILTLRKGKLGTDEGFVFPGVGKSGHLKEPKTSWATMIRRASFYRLIQKMHKEQVLDGEEHAAARKMSDESLTKAEAKYHSIAQSRKIDPQNYVIDDLRIHDLRRTFGSWLGMSGSSLPIIGKSLGHKSVAATKIYTRLELDPLRKSVDTGTSAMLVAGKRDQTGLFADTDSNLTGREQAEKQNAATCVALNAMIQQAQLAGALLGRSGDKLLFDLNKFKNIPHEFLGSEGSYHFKIISGVGEFSFNMVQASRMLILHGSVGDASQFYKQVDPIIEIPHLQYAEKCIRDVAEIALADLMREQNF